VWRAEHHFADQLELRAFSIKSRKISRLVFVLEQIKFRKSADPTSMRQYNEIMTMVYHKQWIGGGNILLSLFLILILIAVFFPLRDKGYSGSSEMRSHHQSLARKRYCSKIIISFRNLCSAINFDTLSS
jgi:hypothetical protein